MAEDLNELFDKLEKELESHPDAPSERKLKLIESRLIGWTSTLEDCELLVRAFRRTELTQRVTRKIVRELVSKLSLPSLRQLESEGLLQARLTKDVLWAVVVWALALVVVITTTALAYCAMYRPGDQNNVAAQTLLNVFTTAVGFLGGTSVVAASQTGQSVSKRLLPQRELPLDRKSD